MSSPPVMSSTPSSVLEAGSWIGVAAQLHRCTRVAEVLGADARSRSGRVASAMPGALVPASRSSQLLPSTKPIALGRAQRRRGAAHPEQLPRGVRDRHDRAAVARRLAEHVVEQREDLRERMRLAVVAQRRPRPA